MTVALMLVAAGRARAGRPRARARAAAGRAEIMFMVEAAARACRNGRPLNSSISGNLKAAARQLRLKPEGHCDGRRRSLGHGTPAARKLPPTSEL